MRTDADWAALVARVELADWLEASRAELERLRGEVERRKTRCVELENECARLDASAVAARVAKRVREEERDEARAEVERLRSELAAAREAGARGGLEAAARECDAKRQGCAERQIAAAQAGDSRNEEWWRAKEQALDTVARDIRALASGEPKPSVADEPRPVQVGDRVRITQCCAVGHEPCGECDAQIGVRGTLEHYDPSDQFDEPYWVRDTTGLRLCHVAAVEREDDDRCATGPQAGSRHHWLPEGHCMRCGVTR